LAGVGEGANMKKEEKRVAIIFGSGATAGSGYVYTPQKDFFTSEDPKIPLDMNFWDIIKPEEERYPAITLLRKYFPELKSMEKTWALCNLAHQHFQGFINRFETKFWLKTYSKNWNFNYDHFKQQIIDLSVEYNRRGRRAELNLQRPDASPFRFLGDFDTEFRHLVGKVYHQENFRDLANQINNFQKLFKCLGCLQAPNFDIIIIFNYDCLAEKSLNKIEHDFVYVSENGITETDVDRKVKISKLHGALNWLQDSRKKSIQFHKGEIQPQYSAKGWQQACMVPPTVNKVEVTRPQGDPNREDAVRRIIAKQWQAAKEILDNADLWIFIGYGFPETDTHALDIFRQGKEKKILYCGINGNPSEQQRIANLLPSSPTEIAFCWNGFAALEACLEQTTWVRDILS
jgi:hypothetical protein